MREKYWRIIDRIYMMKRRKRLAQIYRGDPRDPDVLRREILGPDKEDGDENRKGNGSP